MVFFRQPNIRSLDEKRNVKGLIKALNYKEAEVRSHAAKILGKQGDSSAVEPLIKALGDVDGSVRQSAAESLEILGENIWNKVDTVNLKSTAEGLGKLGDNRACVPLLKILDDTLYSDKYKDVREAVVRALGELGDSRALYPLEDALLDDKFRDVRQSAAVALGKLGDPSAINSLIKVLRDEHWAIRRSASISLINLGDPVAIKPLINLLQDRDKYVSQAAAYILSELNEPRAVEQLLKALEDKRIIVRQSVADALGKLGDTQAVEPLVKLLEDGDKDVRQSAAVALGKLGDPRAVEQLINALKDRKVDVRQSAADALGKIGDPRAKDPLVKLLEDGDEDVRQSAYNALGNLGDNIDSLIGLLKDNNMEVRRKAAEKLGEIGDEIAVKPLVETIKDETEYPVLHDDPLSVPPIPVDARVEAALALGKIGNKLAIETLQEMRNVSTEKGHYRGLTLSEAVDKALSELGLSQERDPSEEIVQLRKMLLSNDYDVRSNGLSQARVIAETVEDKTFLQALQASEKLKTAFDKQDLAHSGTEPMESCHEAILLEPGFSAAYVCLSYLYRHYVKNYDDALAWAKKAVEVDPQNMNAWREIGMIHVALKDVVEAARFFHKVVSTQPQHTNFEPQARLVAVYRRLCMRDCLDSAIQCLSQAGVGLDPDQEKEWDRLVAEADIKELQKAVYM